MTTQQNLSIFYFTSSPKEVCTNPPLTYSRQLDCINIV